MLIVIAGAKGVGKSTVGPLIAERLGLRCVETDDATMDLYEREHDRRYACHEIHKSEGESGFREYERRAVEELAGRDWLTVVTGGSTMTVPESRQALLRDSIVVMLTGSAEALEPRADREGRLANFLDRSGFATFADYLEAREAAIRPHADIILDISNSTPDEIARRAVEQIAQAVAVRSTAANTFGDIIRVTSFGESHGAAVGCVMDGVKPGIEISVEEIQAELARRRPGQSAVTTQRKEPDQIHILSGMFAGKTTGHPIAMVIYNKDQDSSRYEEIKDLFRPGHADFTYYKKYGLRDHRGGGRSSARETAARVAAGAIAKQILRDQGIIIRAHTIEIAGIRAENINYNEIEQNPVRCADPAAAKRMEETILEVKRSQDSVGGIVQLEIEGAPAGLGDPIFAKLDARLITALLSIPASVAAEIGDGFEQVRMRGSESNDWMKDGTFVSNHSGGIIGGISTGMPIVVRIGFKPTSSIAQKQPTIDIHGENREIQTIGRHDPCIVPRAVPVVEHMAALVLLNAWEIQQKLRPDWLADDERKD